jgi:hypothetical protein
MPTSSLSGALVRSVAKLASINLLKFGFLLLVRLNLGFTTEGNLLMCSSYLLLGVPNWVPNTHYHTDEVAAGEVATTKASSGPSGQEDPREVAGEVVKEASTDMRTSEPPEMVAQASSVPRPALGTKADMPVPGTEIGAAAGPPFFGVASGSEKASQGAHTARTMESDRCEASTTPRAVAKGPSGGEILAASTGSGASSQSSTSQL